jgi:hydrogenase nickel incorporation protein HypA/HybF
MHEMGIANSILEAVRTEMRRYPGSRPLKVGLKIGEMSAIDEESLRFCFGALANGTDLAGLELAIAICHRRHRCGDCGREFVVREYDFRCPGCHSCASNCIGGDELELSYVELEDNESSAVGAESSQRK